MNKKLVMLEDFNPLFLPNRSEAEMLLYEDAAYRQKLVWRMLAGEKISSAEFGAKTFVLESGRVSGKTKHDEYAMGIDITKGVGDMWYCRSELGDIRNSIFTSMQSTLHDLGYTLSDNKTCDFHVRQSPFEIMHNRTGNKIQFFAINKDINRTKGYVAPSGRLKRVAVEEANEVDDPKYINALVTTAVRFFHGDSKVVYRLNPPETKQHWSVKHFQDEVAGGAQRIYTTWLQLAKLGLLNPATVGEILKMKEQNPLFYRYWYMGEIVNRQGLVFQHFDRNVDCVRIANRAEIAGITSDIIVAGDAANKNDPTCFATLCNLKDGRILVLDAMYYDPRIDGELDDVALAHMTCDWFNGVLAKYPGLRTKRWIGTVDNANWNLMRMLEMSKAMGWFEWHPATDKNIIRDTNRLQTLTREHMLLFHEAPDNQVHCITAEIENFIYDPKTGEIKKNQSDHGIDMLKYGTYKYQDTKVFF